MILSILIPTIPERYPKFIKLLNKLMRQVDYMNNTHPSLGLVQILFDDSPSFLNGGKSIGAKRNYLRQLALGEYQCFCDDDDDIAPNYVETLARMCNEGADICTFRCMTKTDGFWCLVDMSIKHKNEEANPEKVVKRNAWHVCPVRTEIALKENFDDDLNHNEDWSYMQKILKHVKREVHTDSILTQYNHSEAGSEADKILKSQQ